MGYQAPARALGVARFMEMQDNKPEDNSGSEDNKRWYVVHAYSGFEKSVAQALRDRIVRTGMEARFGDVLVPTEEVVEMRSGQKRRSESKFFPGYVLVQITTHHHSKERRHRKEGVRR